MIPISSFGQTQAELNSYVFGQVLGQLIFTLPFLIFLTWVLAQIFNFQDRSWKKAAIVAVAASGINLLFAAVAIYFFYYPMKDNPLLAIVYHAVSWWLAGTISLQRGYKLNMEGKAALIGILWAAIAYVFSVLVSLVGLIGRYYR